MLLYKQTIEKKLYIYIYKTIFSMIVTVIRRRLFYLPDDKGGWSRFRVFDVIHSNERKIRQATANDVPRYAM